MSITIFIQSRNGASRIEIGRAWLLLPVFLCVVGLGLYQYALQHYSEKQAQIDHERTIRKAQIKQVTYLKNATESQLLSLSSHVALMQAKLARLEALGTQLAQHYQLEDQFNFTSEVGVGGVEHIGDGIKLEQLIRDMDNLVKRINNNNLELPLLETIATNLKIDQERYISGRPIKKGWLSSPYGFRNDPFSGRRTMHKGIDFAGAENTSIVATAGGIVTWAGQRFGYGNLVEIDHGNGLMTRYAHNKAVVVNVGDLVTKGKIVAKMGSTGRSTGPHVHYEVLRNGQQVDPSSFVYRRAN